MIGSVRRAVHVLAALALGAGAFVALAAAPASAADPLGYVIAQGEGECWLASVDLVTGETTTIGDVSPEKCAFDLEFTPDGTRLLGTRIDDNGDDEVAHLVEFDLTTGAVTDLGVLGDFTVGGPGSRPGQPHVHAERKPVHLPRSRAATCPHLRRSRSIRRATAARSASST